MQGPSGIGQHVDVPRLQVAADGARDAQRQQLLDSPLHGSVEKQRGPSGAKHGLSDEVASADTKILCEPCAAQKICQASQKGEMTIGDHAAAMALRRADSETSPAPSASPTDDPLRIARDPAVGKAEAFMDGDEWSTARFRSGATAGETPCWKIARAPAILRKGSRLARPLAHLN